MYIPKKSNNIDLYHIDEQNLETDLHYRETTFSMI